MELAVSLWRLFPTQIRGGLSRYHHRRIEEWLADDFTMSSSELLALISEFPEDSELVKASARTFRVAEMKIDGHSKLVLFAAAKLDARGLFEAVELPEDATLVAEFVDWTHEHKIAARHAAEMAIFRMEQHPSGGYDVDLTGITEPLQSVMDKWAETREAENLSGARAVFRQQVLGQ